MSRIWSTTGLYKASKDRMPAKRSRKVNGTLPPARLVLLPPYEAEAAARDADREMLGSDADYFDIGEIGNK